MTSRTTYRILRWSVLAVSLSVGWALGWLQFGGEPRNKGVAKPSTDAADVAPQGSKADTAATSRLAEGGRELADEECDGGKSQISVFSRIYLQYGTCEGGIVEFAIVNMGSDDVTVEKLDARLYKDSLRWSVFDGERWHPVPTRSTQPAMRQRWWNDIVPWELVGWLTGGARIAGHGGVGIVRFRMPSKNQGLEGRADELLVTLNFDTVKKEGRTHHKFHFAPLPDGVDTTSSKVVPSSDAVSLPKTPSE